MIKYFVITANMKNGDAWETKRHTKAGMETVVADILKDEQVEKFTVVEVGV